MNAARFWFILWAVTFVTLVLSQINLWSAACR